MTSRMPAMQLEAPSASRPVERAVPVPGPGQLPIEVAARGVCRTDLHIRDGDLGGPLPIVRGHELVGRVAALGEGATGFAPGDRAGVPWPGRTCGTCGYCRRAAVLVPPLMRRGSRPGEGP